MAPSSPSVLILDADMTPSLAIARSLGRKGIAVDLACSDSEVLDPVSFFSRHCAGRYRYPDPLGSAEAFCQWVFERVDEKGYVLTIPVTERSLTALARHPRITSYRDRIAIPPADALPQVLDKSRTLDLADELGIPYPKRHLVTSVARLEELADSFTFPAVLKPQASIAQDVQLSVDYAFDRDELLRKGGNLLEQSSFLLQAYVPGSGVGIELIAEQGEIRQAFQHRRIHELPLSGGGSSYRESVPVDPVLLNASERLIGALKWHGVAMVEFKQDRSTGKFWLMEINGRFWGSLPLSVAAGADFPWLLYQLYTEGTLPPRQPAPRIGIHCRKLATDLMWHEQVLRRHYDPRLFTPPGAACIIRELLRVFSFRHRFDVQSWRDMKPGAVDLYRVARDQLRRLRDLSNEKRQKRRCLSAKEKRRVDRLSGRAKHVLFLCHGNINRSILAERLVRASVGEKSTIEVRSAGFHPTGGRPADPVMRAVAADHGFDLEGTSSTVVDKALLDWADVVFVMEFRHIEKVEALAADAVSKTALLGTLIEGTQDPEIDDPYGGTRQSYEDCFERIRRAVSSLAPRLEPPRDEFAGH